MVVKLDDDEERDGCVLHKPLTRLWHRDVARISTGERDGRAMYDVSGIGA
jgi:hypothetical protein